MPFNPNAPTEIERNNAYALTWLGAVCSVPLAINVLVKLPQAITTACLALVAMSLVVSILSRRNDDYFKSLSREGSHWAMVIITIWMFVNAVTAVAEGGYIFGMFAAGAAPSEFPDGQSLYAINIETNSLAFLAVFAFHAGFIFAKYRQ